MFVVIIIKLVHPNNKEAQFNENMALIIFWRFYFDFYLYIDNNFQFEGGVVIVCRAGVQLRQLSPLIGSFSQTVIWT